MAYTIYMQEAAIDTWLLSILACPACKGPVRQEALYLICGACGRRYPIRSGVPVMLVEESQPPEEKGRDLDDGVKT